MPRRHHVCERATSAASMYSTYAKPAAASPVSTPTSTVRRVRRDQNAVRFTIGAPAGIMALIVAQGSITVDGISLTVADLYDDAFEVSVIPHTAAETTLGSHRPGSTVNLENDVVGKYVQRLLYNKNRNTGTPDAEHAGKPASPPLTLEYLAANGF